MTNKELNEEGTHFLLDETTKAYELGGVKKHWMDYSYPDEGWDQDKYYAEFDAWWVSLPYEKKLSIYNEITKK